jgi:hypothetical protein
VGQSWTDSSLTRGGIRPSVDPKPRSHHLRANATPLSPSFPIFMLLTTHPEPLQLPRWLPCERHTSFDCLFLSYRPIYQIGPLPTSLQSGLTSMAYHSRSEVIKNNPIGEGFNVFRHSFNSKARGRDESEQRAVLGGWIAREDHVRLTPSRGLNSEAWASGPVRGMGREG